MSRWARTGHVVAGGSGIALSGTALHLQLLPTVIVVLLLGMQFVIQLVMCVFPQQSKDRLDWWKRLFCYLERRRTTPRSGDGGGIPPSPTSCRCGGSTERSSTGPAQARSGAGAVAPRTPRAAPPTRSEEPGHSDPVVAQLPEP